MPIFSANGYEGLEIMADAIARPVLLTKLSTGLVEKAKVAEAIPGPIT